MSYGYNVTRRQAHRTLGAPFASGDPFDIPGLGTVYLPPDPDRPGTITIVNYHPVSRLGYLLAWLRGEEVTRS